MRVRSNHIANAAVRERPKFRSAVHGSWRLSVETGQQSIGGRRRKHRRRRADSRGRGDEFVYRLGERREQSVRCYTWSVVVGTNRQFGSKVRPRSSDNLFRIVRGCRRVFLSRTCQRLFNLVVDLVPEEHAANHCQNIVVLCMYRVPKSVTFVSQTQDRWNFTIQRGNL